jgi:hypothetical protein
MAAVPCGYVCWAWAFSSFPRSSWRGDVRIGCDAGSYRLGLAIATGLLVYSRSWPLCCKCNPTSMARSYTHVHRLGGPSDHGPVLLIFGEVRTRYFTWPKNSTASVQRHRHCSVWFYLKYTTNIPEPDLSSSLLCLILSILFTRV